MFSKAAFPIVLVIVTVFIRYGKFLIGKKYIKKFEGGEKVHVRFIKYIFRNKFIIRASSTAFLF